MNNEQDLIKTTGLGWAGLNCTALDWTRLEQVRLQYSATIVYINGSLWSEGPAIGDRNCEVIKTNYQNHKLLLPTGHLTGSLKWNRLDFVSKTLQLSRSFNMQLLITALAVRLKLVVLKHTMWSDLEAHKIVFIQDRFKDNWIPDRNKLTQRAWNCGSQVEPIQCIHT
jgi:hypothetical protein